MDQGGSTQGGKRAYDDPVPSFEKISYKKKKNLNPRLRKEKYNQRTQVDGSKQGDADGNPIRSLCANLLTAREEGSQENEIGCCSSSQL